MILHDNYLLEDYSHVVKVTTRMVKVTTEIVKVTIVRVTPRIVIVTPRIVKVKPRIVKVTPRLVKVTPRIKNLYRILWWGLMINPYMTSVLRMGHMQTVQTQIRHRMMRCLITIFTVCKQNVLLDFRKKWEKPPDTSKIWNGLILLMRVGKSILLKWV